MSVLSEKTIWLSEKQVGSSEGGSTVSLALVEVITTARPSYYGLDLYVNIAVVTLVFFFFSFGEGQIAHATFIRTWILSHSPRI